MPRFLALAGNIGVGKTTACHVLAEELGLRQLHEPVLDNRFLRDYYADMARWSFTLQMEFLFKRLDHHRQVQSDGHGYVQDRTLIEDPEVFAKMLHGLGHMTDTELELYFDYCRMLLPQVSQPDAIIVLSCPDINVLLRRIATRGRREESGITASFLRVLDHQYAAFPEICAQKYGIPTLQVDVSEIDIRKAEGRADFIDQVRTFLAELDDASGRLF